MSVNRTMGITQIHDLGRSEDPEAVLSNVDVKLFVLGSGIQDFLVFLECFAMLQLWLSSARVASELGPLSRKAAADRVTNAKDWHYVCSFLFNQQHLHFLER